MNGGGDESTKLLARNDWRHHRFIGASFLPPSVADFASNTQPRVLKHRQDSVSSAVPLLHRTGNAGK